MAKVTKILEDYKDLSRTDKIEAYEDIINGLVKLLDFADTAVLTIACAPNIESAKLVGAMLRESTDASYGVLEEVHKRYFTTTYTRDTTTDLNQDITHSKNAA